MAFILGLDAKLYRNDGTYGAPTWEEIGNVRDLTLGMEKGEADVTVRASNGWRAIVGTLKEATVEFEMVYDPADTEMDELRTAFLGTNVLLDMAVMDGDISVAGTQGLRADFSILSFGRTEELEEALKVPVTMKPGYSLNAPTWMVIP